MANLGVAAASPLISNVEINQLNWLRPDATVATASSVWGKLSFAVVPDPSTTYYLNVVASGLNTAWSVQNMPLGKFDNGKQTVDIDLQELGYAPGADVTNLNYYYTLSTSVQAAQPVGSADQRDRLRPPRLEHL